MKTLSKILILCIACALAIGGIMVYAKTRVSPPESHVTVDQYIQDIDESISSLKSFNAQRELDSRFDELIDRISIFCSEGKITDSDNDDRVNQILDFYSKGFITECFKKFEQSVWNEADHVWMLDRISFLNSIRFANSTPALSSSTVESLRHVATIIGDYGRAKQVSKSTTFRGWSDAKNTLSQVAIFSNNQYLSHNTALMSDLKEVPSRLAQSCYNQLVAKVNQLNNYRSLTEDYYMNTLLPNVNQALIDYDNSASGVFGSKKSTNDLWDKANEYWKAGVDYYSNK